MKRLFQLITLDAPHRQQTVFLFTVVSFIYLFNLAANDIWTPNESFYAEAVREMFESGKFLDISYNYEPRYNKPPLTYWIMAASAGLFGISEFALRLPIVLMGIGSIWLTYLFGKLLYGDRGGVYALVMMAFSVQLLAVKQYASPEIPLTFFFTLTLYFFFKSYKENKSKYLYLSYVALGLTVLTKGYPYIIIIAGIIGLYLLTSGPFSWLRIKQEIRLLKLHIGLPIALIIGLSWVIYMYIKDGSAFWDIYYFETIERAMSYQHGLRPFFYLKVITWSIFPYTFAFIFAFVIAWRSKESLNRVLFPLCWLGTMLIIFTISKGKVPTYMIQAHPALIFIIIPVLSDQWGKKTNRIIFATCFYLPTIMIIGANFYMVGLLHLKTWTYGLAVFSLILFIAQLFFIKGWHRKKFIAMPFWSMAFAILTFSTLLPQLEKYRPYDTIGTIVQNIPSLSPHSPLHIQGTLIHNIPFYAKRKVIRDATLKSIDNYKGEKLALVREENLKELKNPYKTYWKGLIYDLPSESQFAKFILAYIEAEESNFEKFATYHLIYQTDQK